MKVWSFYDLVTGEFTGNQFGGHEDLLEENTPEGCGAIEGAHNAQVTHVNLEGETPEVEAWMPDPPDDDDYRTWEWDAGEGWLPVLTTEGIAFGVRAERDKRLAACDWVVLRAFELSEAVPTDWATYRASLRDITEQEDFPLTVVWPDPPA